MTYKWAKCKFTAEELSGKTIDFDIPTEGGPRVKGIGKLDAKSNPQGLIAARILQELWSADRREIKVQVFFIPAEELDNISQNPPGSKTEFALIAA